MQQFFGWIKDIVFPPICLGCRRRVVAAAESDVELLCGQCCLEILDLATPRCGKCGFPAPHENNFEDRREQSPFKFSGVSTRRTPINEQRSNSDTIYADCLECRQYEFSFEKTTCLGGYQGHLKELLLQAKGASGQAAGFALGQLLGAQLDASQFSRVVTVPMHWRRRLIRHHSTVETLARGVVQQTKIPLDLTITKAIRPTEKQGTLSLAQRRKNMRRAFQIRKPSLIQDQHLLLVDDVMTTGATLDELARNLRKSGAASVEVAVVCRAGWNVS